MSENLFEAQYDLTKKSRLKKFYESNKILIFSSIVIIIILLGSLNFYLKAKENKIILLSENYIQAKIYLDGGNKIQGLDILKKIVFANNATYSTLSLFLILNEDLIEDKRELSSLFDHLLANNKFEDEIKNLLIYKKALLNSNFVTESELLEEIKPLLNAESLWKPHALLLMGDYFVSKQEYLKARDFYRQILSIKNLEKDIYNQAISQLSSIQND
tara:strand:- start:119 stop:766 length:648 start_codon:yes stop_codon:yes gene_type:complete